MEPTPPYTYGLGMVGTASGSEFFNEFCENVPER